MKENIYTLKENSHRSVRQGLCGHCLCLPGARDVFSWAVALRSAPSPCAYPETTQSFLANYQLCHTSETPSHTHLLFPLDHVSHHCAFICCLCVGRALVPRLHLAIWSTLWGKRTVKLSRCMRPSFPQELKQIEKRKKKRK